MIKLKTLLSENKITAYHGSNVSIKKFDKKFSPQGVFWFNTDEEEIISGNAGALSSKYIMKVELNFQNPAGRVEYNRYGLFELEQMGYDSVKLENGNWIVFNSNNIKVLDVKKRD